MDNGTPHTPEAPSTGATGLSLTALQRRRLLLRGVGKGGAVLAAAVPLSSFATAPILKTRPANGAARLCTVSGVGSLLPSMATTTGECRGQTAGYWADTNVAWPAFTVRGRAEGRQTLWSTVFRGPSTGNGALTLEAIMTHGPADQQIWVRALVNAADGYPGSFPYSTGEVLELYADAARRTAAAAFFRDWV